MEWWRGASRTLTRKAFLFDHFSFVVFLFEVTFLHPWKLKGSPRLVLVQELLAKVWFLVSVVGVNRTLIIESFFTVCLQFPRGMLVVIAMLLVPQKLCHSNKYYVNATNLYPKYVWNCFILGPWLLEGRWVPFLEFLSIYTIRLICNLTITTVWPEWVNF